MKRFFLLILIASFGLSCNSNPEDSNNSFNNPSNNINNQFDDKDKDGYTIAGGDCDDNDPDVNPGKTEVPDGKDNNCNGFTDDDYDNDGFGADSDCDDHDPNRSPAQVEVCNDGIDNNCNGLVDLDESDDDGDGFNECDGDCADNDETRSPIAVEIPGDGIDNNCNGAVDEINDPCDCNRVEVTGALSNLGPGARLGDALGLCDTGVFQETIQVLGAQSYAIISYDPENLTPGAFGWGDIKPIPPRQIEEGDPEYPASCQMVALFTGEVLNNEPQGAGTQDLEYTCDHDPVEDIDNAEADDTPATCTDLTQIKLVIRTPPNVNSISFDFLFLSSEYPEWVDSQFNDTFYAIMGKASGEGETINISFDGNGKAITVNNNYFQTPPNWSQSINGTGYEVEEYGEYVGSATGWLTTRAPVEPNEIYEIVFSIHDEGDHVLDSAVVIDNVRWGFEEVEGPITVE
ncbi:MAG: putative metal-binding motif-containing protein [Deltaproteobacteria bacterium]|nr:putative metal-binding motif-containing protein [Deltaproteobacteria bacterium]